MHSRGGLAKRLSPESVFVWRRDDLREVRKERERDAGVFVTWYVAYFSPSMPPCSGAGPSKCSVRILDAVIALAVLLW